VATCDEQLLPLKIKTVATTTVVSTDDVAGIPFTNYWRNISSSKRKSMGCDKFTTTIATNIATTA